MKKLIFLFSVLLATVSCMKEEKHGNDNSSANATRLMAFYDQVMNAHNADMIDSFCTSDFIDHQPFPGQGPGADGLKVTMKDFFTAFPDLHVKVNFVKAWGDTTMAHFTMTGTNSGMWMGGPPSNKQMNIDGVDILVIKDGKASEHWGYMEESKMMHQLGMGGSPEAHNDMEMKK